MSTPTSVRAARHTARNDLAKTLNTLQTALQTAVAGIFATLEGREGLTPDEQAALLTGAAEQIQALPDVFAGVAASTDQIGAGLADAATFATTRDFDAHQTAKAAAGDGALPSLDGDGFVVPTTVE